METWKDWISLKTVPGIGDRLYARLIDRFKNPATVFQAAREKRDRFHNIPGVAEKLIDAIARHQPSANISREFEDIEKAGYRLITLTDTDYPRLLLEIPDPPPYLYLAGSLPDTVKNIAVVGSRNATPYGVETTQRLSCDLVAHQAVIISGMALGIDTAAHEGALVGRGQTVAVLGSGLQRIYPPRNRSLFNRIVENGGILSEFPLRTGPEAHHFPKRNRIISGISLGTIVVEATKRSGSLITARLAAEQNREVFAVPGNIQSFKSTGTHALIKQGAKLVECAQDVLEEFPLFFNSGSKETQRKIKTVNLNKEKKSIFEVLSAYPLHIDDLAQQTGMHPGRLAGLLIQMELSGYVTQAPGNMFTRHLDYC